ncbi:MAG: hypothetical protein P4L86_29335 [Mycobacterium sp.]|nr:hypothetical protein [Mycobacterium sp.]
MRARTKCATLMLAIVATTVAAPIAGVAAASSDQSGGQSQVQQSCVSLGSAQSQCQSPGDVEIYDAPPQVDYFSYAGGAT